MTPECPQALTQQHFSTKTMCEDLARIVAMIHLLHRRAAVCLPQGEGNLLVRIPLPLHGTTPSSGFRVPENVASKPDQFQG